MEEISAKKGLLYAHTACRIIESYRSVSTRIFQVGLEKCAGSARWSHSRAKKTDRYGMPSNDW